jgi:tetratricopeptide (TPR) repeat protein
MNKAFASQYYRLALSAATRRDLSRAALYARYACLLDEGHGNAARLLGLCLYELGALNPAADVLSADPALASAAREAHRRTQADVEGIQPLIRRHKWRQAALAAGAIPHQSARVLNIQACLFAAAKRYKTAARFFAKALEKDRGSRFALAGLTETASCRKWFWENL